MWFPLMCVLIVRLTEGGNEWLRFENFPSEAIGYPGERLTIKCEVIGSPAPSVAWFKGDQHAINIPKSLRQQHYSTSGVIAHAVAVLNIFDLPSNPEYHTCVAQSGNVTVKQTTLVQRTLYYDQYKMSPIRLTIPILMYYKSVLIPVGGLIEVPCLSKSDISTQSERYWLNKHNQHLTLEGRVRISKDGKLVIQNARLNDTGAYKCVFTQDNNWLVRLQTTNVITFYAATV